MKKFIAIILLFTCAIFSQWSLILMPDTQYDIGAVFDNATNWIKNHVDSLNVQFVLHLGDITNYGNQSEWDSADNSISVLDGVVPYSLAVGNHDMYQTRNLYGLYNLTFPKSRYDTLPTWGGNLEVIDTYQKRIMENHYMLFSAGGVDYLIITLEFRANQRDTIMAWANSVVSSFPNRQVILNTHTYMNDNDTRVSDGEEMWQKFVKNHENMFLVVCGHRESLGAGRLMSLGTHGNKVYQLLSNIQSLSYGAYYIRIMTFYPGANRITVKSFSPELNKFWHDNEYEFSIHTFDIDLANGSFVAPLTMEREGEDFDLAQDMDIQVFPNPVSSGTIIKVTSGQKPETRGQTVEIKILNITGKIVYRLASDLWHLASGISWHPASLPNGVYLLKAKIGKHKISKKLFLSR